MVQAAQLMDPRVPLVRHDEPAHSCVQLMGPSGHLIVVDGGGQLVGVLDRTSLLQTAPGATARALSFPPPTVRPDHPAAAPLSALLRHGGTSVVVTDPQERPLGLISMSDAVQVARFVLPPPWRVRALMRRHVGDVHPQSHPYRVHIDEEARRGADVVALAGAPVPVFDRADVPLGMVSALDVVDALANVLAPADSVFVNPIS